MGITGETRLVEVMDIVDKLELKVEKLEEGGDKRQLETSVLESDRFKEVFKEIIEEFNESNEIPNNDVVVDLIGDTAPELIASAMDEYDPSDAISSHMEYEEYCTSDCVRDMISEYSPDHSEAFLEEAESFFRNIIAGLPSCWIQAIARILDNVTRNNEQKSEDRTVRNRNLTLKNKTLKILEDEHGFNYQEVLSKVTKDRDEEIKKEANEKAALTRKGELENAKLKVDQLESEIKREESESATE